MDKRGLLQSMARRATSVLALLVLSGCSMFATQEPPPPPPPELPPVVEPIPEPVPEPEPEPIVEPQPEPEPEPPPPVVKPLVAVVLSDRTPAYVEVAAALESRLERQEVYDLSDRSQLPRDAFAAISASDASAIVAIGLPAARAASRFSTLPVVVGQVFNLSDGELLSGDVRAVSALPPIGLQADAWHRIDPSVRNVGAIVGPGHDEVIAEAENALAERGIKFHYAVAETDRETLYLFNRLVRDIDGFILFPDNRILSRSVLGEMMTYANRHRVQVAVFNDPLLQAGALFSSTAVEDDIARQIVGVVGDILDGRIESTPPVTPLSEMELKTNPAVLERMGLAARQEAVADAMGARE